MLCVFAIEECVVRLMRILIDQASQTLELTEQGRLLRRSIVSTGLNGSGEQQDSGCTPRGLHRVRIRIGIGCPEGAVFVGRRATGEVYDAQLARQYPQIPLAR